MARKPRRVSKESVAKAAARAEKRSKGEEIIEAPAPIDPPIIMAAEIKKAAVKPKPRTRGRPSRYTPAMGKAICKMLSSGMTLLEVCRRPAMPRESVVRWWAAQPDHPFSAQYVRARTIGYMHMGDDLLAIADNSANDWVERAEKDGRVSILLNREALERSRLRIDTRKWLLSKALPKVFGDKVALEHTGANGGPIAHESVPQPTGEDHLDDLTKRYATKTASLMKSLNGHVNGHANGHINGSGTKH